MATIEENKKLNNFCYDIRAIAKNPKSSCLEKLNLIYALLETYEN